MRFTALKLKRWIVELHQTTASAYQIMVHLGAYGDAPILNCWKVMPKHNKNSVLFKCNNCNYEEFIPKDVIEFFDVVDPSIQGAPPVFQCQHCSRIMFPVDKKAI